MRVTEVCIKTSRHQDLSKKWGRQNKAQGKESREDLVRRRQKLGREVPDRTKYWPHHRVKGERKKGKEMGSEKPTLPTGNLGEMGDGKKCFKLPNQLKGRGRNRYRNMRQREKKED